MQCRVHSWHLLTCPLWDAWLGGLLTSYAKHLPACGDGAIEGGAMMGGIQLDLAKAFDRMSVLGKLRAAEHLGMTIEMFDVQRR